MSAYNGFYEDAAVVCPRCMGDGSVDCNCGGDLCVCENYGERDCPVCHGEGEVSAGREAQYNEGRRQFFAAINQQAGGRDITGVIETGGSGVETSLESGFGALRAPRSVPTAPDPTTNSHRREP